MPRRLLLVLAVLSATLLGGCGDQDVGLAPTTFSGEHEGRAWDLIVTDPGRADPKEPEGQVCTALGWEESAGGHGGWGDYCGWTLPGTDEVVGPIMLRPGGGGYPGKLHGLAGEGVENIQIVFVDGSTTMASTVSLGPARVDAVGYVAFFDAGTIPSEIVGTNPSGDVVDKVQAPERYADDLLRSIPVSPSDP